MSGNSLRLTAIIRRAISVLHRRVPGYGLAGIAAAGMFAATWQAPAAHARPVSRAKTGLMDVVRAYHARAQTAVSRAASAALPLHTVAAGESISSVSADTCQTAADWTGVYAASRRAHLTARNANVLKIGQQLAISCDQVPSMAGRAVSAPAVRTVASVASGNTGAGGSGRSPAPHVAAAPAAGAERGSGAAGGSVSIAGYGAYQACVISRESGGQVNVMNASGHYGLYQFDYSTWVSGGGAGADFGHASVAEQNRVFASVYAARGTSPWTPSDGC